MDRVLIAVLLIQSTLVLPSRLRAQAVDRQGRIRESFSHAGARFRLHGPTVGTLDGRLVQVDDRSVTLSDHTPVPLTELDTVWRRGRATLTGGIVGSALLTLPGAIVGSFAAGMCETSSCPSQGEGVIVGAAFGAATGFLFGAVIGTLIPKWHRIFP
jgi:hypothetical protein